MRFFFSFLVFSRFKIATVDPLLLLFMVQISEWIAIDIWGTCKGHRTSCLESSMIHKLAELKAIRISSQISLHSNANLQSATASKIIIIGKNESFSCAKIRIHFGARKQNIYIKLRIFVSSPKSIPAQICANHMRAKTNNIPTASNQFVTF